MQTNKSKKIITPPRTIFFIFLIVASLIIAYSLVELKQSKKELIQLMEEQSHSLLESVLASSKNALLSYEAIEEEMRKRLLNNANSVRLLYNGNQISDEILKKISDENEIYRINIFNNKGKKIFSNHEKIHTDLAEKYSPSEFLSSIFDGSEDTLFLGIKEARFEDGYRFAVAISAKNRTAIVLNQNADVLINFRRSIGFGALLKNLTSNEGIIFAILEDTTGIIAASGNLIVQKGLNEDSFLKDSWQNSSFKSRLIKLDSIEVFEAVHPFSYQNEIVGLLRLGLPADQLSNISDSNEMRLIIMGVILLLLGSILLAYTFKKQNFEILQKNYKIIESYSETVIENVSDAVIVLDSERYIKTFNKAAERLFKKTSSNVIQKKINSILQTKDADLVLSTDFIMQSLNTYVDGIRKYLLISKNKFKVTDGEENTILVMKDLTKLKQFEDQINRRDRLVAMGELASGVAHEIRNPLNTISTITQQLSKDFKPIDNIEEYEMLTKLVNKEINRINNTVKDFLRFSKPEKISLAEFKLSDLINQLKDQYSSFFNEKSVTIETNLKWDGNVNWDRNQIQQALMNLLQNSYDASNNKSKIEISSRLVNELIELSIKDNGKGIPKDLLNKIFNLYFSTKAKGTGIGLSIVQRIVYEHNGMVEVESIENEGTTFLLRIPIKPNLN